MALSPSLHAACYVLKHKRQPLRQWSAKLSSRCAHCAAEILVGEPLAYDVVPPSAPTSAANVNAKPALSLVKETPAPMLSPALAAAPASAPSVDLGALASLVSAAVSPLVQGEVARQLAATAAPALDEDRVIDIARREAVIATRELDRPTRIEIVTREPSADGPPAPQDLGLVHCQFDELLALVRAGRHVWLHGPAGSGKTYVVSQVAKALGRTYRMQGAIADRYADLIGYRSVTDGAYQRTPFRDSVEHGGLHLIDEIDASQDPGSPLAINAALANHLAPFPDGLVRRHPDFALVAAANTKGLGADADYVGRIRFDAAFLDRFTILEWQIDERLERALYPEHAPVVQSIRKEAKDRGIKALITPRATERLAALRGAGIEAKRALRLAVGGLMTDAQWEQVSK